MPGSLWHWPLWGAGPVKRLPSLSTRRISVFGYQQNAGRQKAGKKQVVTVWLDSRTPGNSFKTTPVDLTIQNGNFDIPVWVDLLTGHIYEIPKSYWSKSGTTYTFKNIPVYDSPVLIADASIPSMSDSANGERVKR